jgi:hypothetical protein
MKTHFCTTQPHQHKLGCLLASIIALFSMFGLRSIYLQAAPISSHSYAAIQSSVYKMKLIKSKPYHKLIWSDEFNGLANQPPNPHIWSSEIGGGQQGWGNQQIEYDINNNAYQDKKRQSSN